MNSSNQNRYGTYKRTRLPRQKRTLLQSGSLEDASKYYKCWNCGAICNIERETLSQGDHGMGGSNPKLNLSLLLHMDGDDASTTFTDSSPVGSTVTAGGNAQIDTAYYKFATGSGIFDGASYLTISDSTYFDLSATDWTIDFWVRGNWSGTGSEYVYYQQTDSSNYFAITILKEATGYGVVLSIYEDGSEVVSLSTGTPCITTATWTHVEVSDVVTKKRFYTTSLDTTTTYHNYRIYVNGGLMASTQDTDGPANYTGTIYIGSDATPDNYLNGWLDEYRVIKAVNHTDTRFDVADREYDEDDSDQISGMYSTQVTAGCYFCGSTNYK